ncbi:MAG: hypothetical protein ACREOJ_07050 [Gemmatimonadaceae bacterium]
MRWRVYFLSSGVNAGIKRRYGKGMSQITLVDFPKFVVAAFPELGEEFAEDAELPYAQMGAFARLMQRAKGQAAWEADV